MMRPCECRLGEVRETGSDGFFTLDSDWRFGAFNRASEDAFDARRQNVIGRVIWEAFPELAGTRLESRLRHAAASHEIAEFEIDLIGERPLSLAITVVPTDDGGVTVAFSVTSARQSPEAERLLLVNELNHRVQNSLAVVQSLAAQSFRAHDSVEAARTAFDGRLATLSGAHRLLAGANWHSALLGDVIEAAIAASADRARFSVQGPAVEVPAHSVVSLALALHELCINASIHGALRLPTGRVTICWRGVVDSEGADRLHFSWGESGGPCIGQPATRGFGSRLLDRAFAGELRGRVDLDFAPGGFQCDIDFPVPLGC